MEYQQKFQEHLNLQQNSLDVIAAENINLREQLNQERANITGIKRNSG